MVLGFSALHPNQPQTHTHRARPQGVWDALLDILAAQARHDKALRAAPPAAAAADTAAATQPGAQGAQGGLATRPGEDGYVAFLVRAARSLVGVSYTRKARYGRLAALVGRLGAGRLMAVHPPLIREALLAMQVGACTWGGCVLGSECACHQCGQQLVRPQRACHSLLATAC